MDRDQFLEEAMRRGYRREQLFFYPGPDEQRDPEGGIVVEGPNARHGRHWRTYRMDRGVRDEALSDAESAAYEHVLDTFMSGGAPPLTLPGA